MQRVLLFDGVCVFCNGSVRWLMARDPGAKLRFAPLQGETAAALRARHPEIPEQDETAVLVEMVGGDERVSLRSTAVLRALAALDTPWRHLAWLRVVPSGLRDVAYRALARLRYRLFGRYEQCPIPSPDERSRFLP